MKSISIPFLFFEDILPRTKVMKENTKSSKGPVIIYGRGGDRVQMDICEKKFRSPLIAR